MRAAAAAPRMFVAPIAARVEPRADRERADRHVGVELRRRDLLHREPELLGRDLAHRRRRALAELGDAVEQRDGVVGVDLEPRVDLRGDRRAGHRAGVRRVERVRVVERLAALAAAPAAIGHADHEARAPEERPPRDLVLGEDARDRVVLVSCVVLIYFAPFAITAAAFWIAVRIRG